MNTKPIEIFKDNEVNRILKIASCGARTRDPTISTALKANKSRMLYQLS